MARSKRGNMSDKLTGGPLPLYYQVAYRITRWLSDPWSLGGHSYRAVGSGVADRERLTAPVVGRLFLPAKPRTRFTMERCTGRCWPVSARPCAFTGFIAARGRRRVICPGGGGRERINRRWASSAGSADRCHPIDRYSATPTCECRSCSLAYRAA